MNQNNIIMDYQCPVGSVNLKVLSNVDGFDEISKNLLGAKIKSSTVTHFGLKGDTTYVLKEWHLRTPMELVWEPFLEFMKTSAYSDVDVDADTLILEARLREHLEFRLGLYEENTGVVADLKREEINFRMFQVVEDQIAESCH